MANESSEALAQLGLLNRQFADAVSPLSNFAAQNAQLAITQERALQAQRDKLSTMQFQSDLDMKRQEAQNAFALKLSGKQAQQAKDNALEVAKFNAGHQDYVHIKEQADKIRGDQRARRLLGTRLNEYNDDEQGNRSLVAAFVEATSDPAAVEKIDTDDAVAITKQIRDTVGRLTSTVSNSPQSKQAIQAFLATPGVPDLLISKGKLTSQDIDAIRQSGDASKIAKVIDQVAKEATWFYGSDKNVLSQLTNSWNQALLNSGSVASPDQLVNADYLKALLGRRDAIINGGNITSEGAWGQLSKAAGFSGDAPKLPPPPAATGLLAPRAAQPGAMTNANPFAAPPAATSDKTGVARAIEQAFSGHGTPNGIGYGVNGVTYDRQQEDPFNPQPFARDPHTEFAIRKNLIDKRMTQQAWASGITSAIPGVPTYEPSYGPYQASGDESKLANFVQQLYSPTRTPTKDQLYPSAPVPVMQPNVPVIQRNPYWPPPTKEQLYPDYVPNMPSYPVMQGSPYVPTIQPAPYPVVQPSPYPVIQPHL